MTENLDIPYQLPAILNRRKCTKLSSSIIDNHMWGTIESYAVDFDKDILPPFIHRSTATKYLGAEEVNFFNLPEPLANCKQIVHMYLQKIPACAPFVQKNLILEVQRLHYEASTLHWGRLAADEFSFPNTTTKLCSSHSKL
jgi:hypothetical protein